MTACFRRPPLRLLVAILGTLSCSLVYTQRSAMSVAIVAMTTTTSTSTSNSNSTKPEFEWSEKLQGVILGSQFYLYIVGPTIAGHITDRLGAKWINFLGAIVPCLLSLLTPIGVRSGGVGVLIAIRTVDGLFHSAVYASLFSLYIRWFADPGERAFANGATFFGGCLGSTVMYSLAGWACGTAVGWPLVYYINAALYLPWMAAWILVVSNDPEENRFIGEEELAAIRERRGVGANGEKSGVLSKRPTPWKAIFTSKPVLSSLVLKTASGFGYFLLMTKMPSYLSSVLGIKLFSNGLFSGGISLAQGLCALGAAPLSNCIITRLNWPTLRVRKAFQCVAMLGPAVCFAAIPSLDGGGSNTLVLVLLLGAMFSYGFFTGGEWSTGSEFAPNSAGVVFGVSNMLAFAMGVVAPLLVGVLLDVDGAQIRAQWAAIFYGTAALYVIGLLPFLVFGTVTQQEWDKRLLEVEVEEFKEVEGSGGSEGEMKVKRSDSYEEL